MIEKPDIKDRRDIEKFIILFYQNVIKDDTIGTIFTKIFPLNWEQHIPLITDFWEIILLDNPCVQENAMEIHYELNKTYKLKKKHFDAWLHLFNTTIDHMYSGEKVLLAKKRAAGIAALMLLKMDKINLQHG